MGERADIVWLRWLTVRLLVVCFITTGSPLVTAQSGNNTVAPSNGSQPPFRLKVGSNLVVVRVVVRDANGKPVMGLQKQDFELFDRGKEQSISQFEPEKSDPTSSDSHTVAPPAEGAARPKMEAPNRFIAFYFDTLNTPDQEMTYLRQAADRYFAVNMHPRERVGIFTSDKMLVDFTDDPQQIHTALSNLKTNGQAMLHIQDCPDLSDYQALQIMQQENPAYSDAWQIAMDQARLCGITASSAGPGANEGPETSPSPQASTPPDPSGDSVLAGIIRSMARNVLFQSELQARMNLLGLERVVNYIAQMPGQRTVVLVSPGFLSESEKYTLDDMVDRAIRSQVIISSLDPRGLATLMEADASQKWIPGKPGTADRLSSQRELVIQDVLAEVANETGGTFFHNNNDFRAGFGALAGSPVDYVLAFAPNDLKNDGKFHSLKVKLTEKHEGYSVQARNGYFAPRSEAEAAADAKRQAVFDAEAKEQEQIRAAMFSKTQSQQLQVGLGGKLSDGQGGMRQLSLISHLDAQPLHFEKDGEHNVNTVSFVFAIFDQQDNLVTAQLKRAHLSVPDGQLQGLRKDGVSVNTRFQLKPGTYRIREVVTDSEDHHMTAVSTTLRVP